MVANANATTFEFDGLGDGSAVDSPTNVGNIVQNCGTAGGDFCTLDFAEGFDYSEDGIFFNAAAFSGGTGLGTDGFVRGAPALLIQDLIGPNQGLGVISTSEFTNGTPASVSADQINFDTGESILFTFLEETNISQIFLNSGTSGDCPDLDSSEGPCGEVGVIVDGVLNTFTDFVGAGILADGGSAVSLIGTTFEFVSLTAGGGFSIESFVVGVPIPGAIPLLLSGIAGLGFASRKKKKA